MDLPDFPAIEIPPRLAEHQKELTGFFREFKEFAVRGNVVDMAVGIIIGAAFTSVVQSLVNDILMPPLGWVVGSVDFSQLAVVLPVQSAKGEPVAINYGKFINAIINFVLVAFA